MSPKKAELFLLPTPLSNTPLKHQIPEGSRDRVRSLRHFICETPKIARRHLKSLDPEVPIGELELYSIGKQSDPADFPGFLSPCENGTDMALLSDAGCPGIADPGASIVRSAHERGIRVRPLIGPSSFTLALMASGLNGQQFSFHGYSPYDARALKNKLQELERRAKNDESQIIMEAPHRNMRLLEAFIDGVDPQLQLCIARELTGTNEFIKTRPIGSWKGKKPELHKIPTLFILGRSQNS